MPQSLFLNMGFNILSVLIYGKWGPLLPLLRLINCGPTVAYLRPQSHLDEAQLECPMTGLALSLAHVEMANRPKQLREFVWELPEFPPKLYRFMLMTSQPSMNCGIPKLMKCLRAIMILWMINFLSSCHAEKWLIGQASPPQTWAALRLPVLPVPGESRSLW